MNYDDAFTLEPVVEQLLDNFNFVAGIVPILTTHIRKVHNAVMRLSFMCNFLMDFYQYGSEHQVSKLDFKSTQRMKSALEDLAEFMSTVNEIERKDRQKLLRNLKVICCTCILM